MKIEGFQVPAWVFAVATGLLVLILLMSFLTGRVLSWSPLGVIDRPDNESVEALPSGMIAFFKTECPTDAGWSSYGPGQGRYLVGVPRSGTVEASVGMELSDKENRPAGQHQHTYNRYNFANRRGDPQMMFRSPGGGLVVVGTEKTDSGDGLKPGTNAPYIQLHVCEKL